ncbi:hypothetical protein HN615_05685 [Candidatus Woesearchaeota archaeon]|mgnify:FL=1|nr:hypothetical protein [Candidatus Woesearchaeota archaeon]
MRSFLDERLSPIMVLILFCINETWVNRFYSKFYKKVGFLSLSSRVKKSSNFLDDFFIEVKGLKNFKEVNLVMRGDSISEYEDEIDYEHITFYLNVYEKGKSNCPIYLTADGSKYLLLKKLNLSPSILIDSVNPRLKQSYFGDSKCFRSFLSGEDLDLYVSHKSGDLPLGSGLVAIICLASITKKLNIYGIDNYFDDHLNKKSYYQYLMSIYKTPFLSYRRLDLIAEKFINLYYLNKMMDDNRFNIRSFLTSIESHDKINNKIERMICSD